MKYTGTVKKNYPLLIACLFFVITFTPASRLNAQEREEKIPKVIETFTLTEANPRREFYDGKLKIELVSSTSDNIFKRVNVRISSNSQKAEYNDEWQQHIYIEQMKYYVGNPVSGSPFKCMEGWFYYKKSAPGSVTLSLHEGPESVNSIPYKTSVFLNKNFKYIIMTIGWFFLAIILYYFTPLIWSFISIQMQARAYALKTGFKSSPVLLYIIKRIPLVIAVYYFFDLFFGFNWKSIAGAILIAVCLQIYFRWYNRKQLQIYAAIKHMKPSEKSGKPKKNAYTGHVKGLPVNISLNGILMESPSYDGDISMGSPLMRLSFIVIQITLKNDRLNGLTLSRNKKKQYGWDSFFGEEICEAAAKPLTALSRLPRYGLGSIEIIDGRLTAVKIFAPDTPAEINILTDLIADLASSLSGITTDFAKLKS